MLRGVRLRGVCLPQSLQVHVNFCFRVANCGVPKTTSSFPCMYVYLHEYRSKSSIIATDSANAVYFTRSEASTTLYLHYLVLTLSRVSSPNSGLLCAVGYPEEKSILVVQSYNPRICWRSIHHSHFFQIIALISIFIRGFRRLMNFWLASRSFKRQSSTRVTNQHTNYDEPAYL